MARKKTAITVQQTSAVDSKDQMPADPVAQQLIKDLNASWDALMPFRQSWDDKELALLAQNNDSFSGNVVKAKVTDAALSTLAFERQARVAAQIPTGKVYTQGKADAGKAKLANIVLNRYIIPGANAVKPYAVKQRLWGVYASVFGSMPMLYDYRVDDDYVGPDCWLVDPRMFYPQPGRNSIQESDWAMVSTIVSTKYLKKLMNKKNTTWDKVAIQKIFEKPLESKNPDDTPTRQSDQTKEPEVQRLRYSRQLAVGQVELVTKYESGNDGHWITFAPDYEGIVVRDIPNPHQSGKIPIVMRECFPLMNSIYGLGDFERGMKLQKAKDSLLGLRLEYAKNMVFPPLFVNPNVMTASTVQYGAGQKWIGKDPTGVMPIKFGSESASEFQGTWSALEGMLQNQFGTTTTQLNAQESANPAFGKTPQAIAQMQQRENARDTWDMFMHEQASQELLQGMLNLLTVKMEKPINFAVFDREIQLLGEDYPDLKVAEGNKDGILTVQKSQLSTKKGYSFLIDANSSMKQDDSEQFQSLSNLLQMIMGNPMFVYALEGSGYNFNIAEMIKKLFMTSGITDWDMILTEGPSPGAQTPKLSQLMQQMRYDKPNIRLNYNDLPPAGQMQAAQEAGIQLQPQDIMQKQATDAALKQKAPLPAQHPANHPINSQDPQIAQVAQMLMQDQITGQGIQ